jgi:ParB family transcriptional regulator, chromosome partitioning protein
MRLRAARRAGLLHVPIAVRAAAADPYAQVAENQKRCPLSPLDLARFIRGRVGDGDSNATIAKRLGMDLTSIAHHLALLELPPELDRVLKTGRCTSPRTLYELSKLHDEQPDRINALVTGEGEITRSAVAALRAASASTSAPNAAFAKRSTSLVEQANAACARLEVLVIRVKKSEPAQAQPELAALRRRVADLADRLA